MKNNINISAKHNPIWVVMPAAGIGHRMGEEIPKQYLKINGEYIIDHTLNVLSSHPYVSGIVVAIDENDQYWGSTRHSASPNIYTTAGGEKRADSVVHGLRFLTQLFKENQLMQKNSIDWVLVHDAARPCVSPKKISLLVETCVEHNAGGILGVPIKDTVKKIAIDKNNLRTVLQTQERQNVWLAHTPQMFPLTLLTKALNFCLRNNMNVTDEASAIENFENSQAPLLVEDVYSNIKITVPEDLLLAEYYLNQSIIKDETKGVSCE